MPETTETTKDLPAQLAGNLKNLMCSYMRAALTCADRATDLNVRAVRDAEGAVWRAIDRLRDLASCAGTAAKPAEFVGWVTLDKFGVPHFGDHGLHDAFPVYRATKDPT